MFEIQKIIIYSAWDAEYNMEFNSNILATTIDSRTKSACKGSDANLQPISWIYNAKLYLHYSSISLTYIIQYVYVVVNNFLQNDLQRDN